MVETIDKIRNRISKLLNKIADLEHEFKEREREYAQFSEDFSLKIIEQKDGLLQQKKVGEPIMSDKEMIILDNHIASLDKILKELGVEKLSSPLDRLASFIKIVGIQKDKKRSNGLVVEVVKIGYLQDDELLRPTHVIIVDNDK